MPGVFYYQIINKNDKEEGNRNAANLAKENLRFSEEDLKKVLEVYQDRIPEKKILLSTMQTYKINLNQDLCLSRLWTNQTQIKGIRK